MRLKGNSPATCNLEISIVLLIYITSEVRSGAFSSTVYTSAQVGMYLRVLHGRQKTVFQAESLEVSTLAIILKTYVSS